MSEAGADSGHVEFSQGIYTRITLILSAITVFLIIPNVNCMFCLAGLKKGNLLCNEYMCISDKDSVSNNSGQVIMYDIVFFLAIYMYVRVFNELHQCMRVEIDSL